MPAAPTPCSASAQPGDDWTDWGSDLPIRKLWWASAPALQPFPPFAELNWRAEGWSARIPLARRTAILVASEKAGGAPDIPAAAGTSRVSTPVGEGFVTGCRSTWRDNVVALGDAACRIEPADLMSLHLLHAGIANLIAWIPAAEDETWALREHVNGALRRQAESARDFQAARYRLSDDAGASAAGLSDALKHRAAVFAARGRVPVFDDDAFDEGLWSLQLAGLGIVPRSADPRAQRISRDQREKQLTRLDRCHRCRGCQYADRRRRSRRMTPERAIRRIIICGGGTAGWMSAAALSRMLPAHEVALTLVQSSDIGTVGVGEATIPPIVQFNRMLGIDEDEFLAATNATFKLGIEFVDWRRRGHTYMHPFGLFGADMHEVSFHHFWRRAVANGMSDAVMAFNAEMQLAYSGSAVRPAPPLNYAYQFDATATANIFGNMPSEWSHRDRRQDRRRRAR